MVQGAVHPIDAVVGEDQETIVPMSEKGPWEDGIAGLTMAPRISNKQSHNHRRYRTAWSTLELRLETKVE
jgi:hypothetical protein